MKEMDRVGQPIAKTEPIAYEGSYECPICMESCRGENRVLSCARCPGVRKMHAACFEGWGKKGCIQCGGAISEYTASSATSSSTVASAPVVLLESDDGATTMQPKLRSTRLNNWRDSFWLQSDCRRNLRLGRLLPGARHRCRRRRWNGCRRSWEC